MVHIYSDDGTEGPIDLHSAKHELAKSGTISNTDTRRAVVAEITAATLLDIAGSLRWIAAEARAAMPDPWPQTSMTAPAEIVEPEGDVFLKVGDIVAVEGHSETAHIVGFGSDQGETYASLVFESGADARIWTRLLSLLDSPDEEAEERAAEESTIETLRALNAEADGEPDLVGEWHVSKAPIEAFSAENVEDFVETVIEDDFGPGDPVPDIDPEHEVDPLGGGSPLDALKASQAARKPAKKKGGKK